MISKLKFNPTYLVLTILLFITEVLIALYVTDNFIRPYLGDTLVVILIFSFVKTFFDFKVLPTALGVLIFAFIIETAQYFQLVKILGLQDITLARIVIGSSFSWWDMVAYVAGFLIILLFRIFTRKFFVK